MKPVQFPFFSGALYARMTCNVLLPAGYDEADEKRYPVIYLLHGLYGTPAYWEQRCDAVQTLTGMMERGALRPSVIVMPSDGGYGQGTYYINWYDGTGRFEDYFVYDLVPAVDRQFKTMPGPANRVLCGMSMGGLGAVVLALRHPERFGAAASMSGALASPETITDQLLRTEICRAYGPIHGPYAQQYDPYALAAKLAKAVDRPALYLNCGTEDEFYGYNRLFSTHLEQLGYTHQYEEFSGMHHSDFWKQHLPDAMSFMEHHFSRIRPVSD